MLAWAAALAVGIVTARLVGSDLAALHGRARSLGAPVEVVVATHDLPIGTTVTDADVATVTRHESQVPDGALGDPERAVGRTVAVPLLRDATVLAGHLADPGRRGTAGIVAPGTRAVRVPLDEAVRPEPGDLVDVLGSFDPSLGPSETSRVVASAATVLDVDDGGGEAALGSGLGVTVLVTVDEAEQIAYALAHGVVTIALAPPEDACCKTSSWESSRG